MSIFYTRKGDDGKSRIGKKIIDKTRVEIEALGQLDELNSMIGVLKSSKISIRLRKILHEIQENLFIIQAQIASIMLDNNFKAPKFKNEKIKEIEKIIDEIETKLPPLRNFIISGTGKTSAWLDWLRAKSRSVERSVLKIKNSKINIFSNILPYLNRLSSLFFALARLEARNKKEQHPKYE